MTQEMKHAIDELARAYQTLQEGICAAQSQLEKDGVIQRFEYTSELLWKTIKIFLEDAGIVTKTPKDAYKQAFKIGWIVDEASCLNLLKDRNLTSHMYQQHVAAAIFDRICSEHGPFIEAMVTTLRTLA